MTMQLAGTTPRHVKSPDVIVAEAGGRERRYPAAAWAFVRDRGGNVILEIERYAGADQQPETIASYAPGGWLAVRAADAEGPNAETRALAIARKGLDDLGRLLAATPRGGLEVVDYATVLERVAAIVTSASEGVWWELEG